MSRFIICRASAGSGKTYALVRQFIEASISSASQLESRFEHILAITFTNKAANGMKERIIEQLREIVACDPDADDLCNEMAADLSIDVGEVRSRCAILQSAILHHYSDFSVCTIDSFVHRLVRTFAHDLKLPMNFDVMIDNQQIIQSSVDELLSMAGTDDKLTRLLCAFTESRMDSGKSYKLESQLAELAKEIFKEETPKYLKELEKISLDDYLDIHKRLSVECRKFESMLATESRKLMDACSAEGLSVDDFPYKKSGALSFFLRLADGDLSKVSDSHARTDDAYNNHQLWSKSTPQAVKDRMVKILPVYEQTYEKVMSILEKELKEYNSRQLLLANIYGLALLSRLSQIKNDYYQENEIVHISEFNKRIADEVVNEPTPFIYERIGSRYYNYMIDEFQDTSRQQWLNFLPLLDEAMTHQFSSDTALAGTQSMVVGDGKQAIYRFRQGDVRQFMMLPQVESPLHGHSLATNAHVEPLRKNYRTLSNIVQFNNCFFETVIKSWFGNNPELEKLYLGEGEKADLIQEYAHEGGYVQISFTEKEDIFESILSTIRHQVDDLGYSYGDIMVLARDNDTLVKISDYIVANGNEKPVPIVSSESFLLSGSREVLLLQSLLEYLHDPSDHVAALSVLRLASETGCLSSPKGDETAACGNCEQLEWRLRDAGFDLAAVLEDLIPHDHVRAFDVDRLRTMALYDLCEALIRMFSLDGKQNRFLATFMNVVNNMSQKGKADLGVFVSYLSENIGKLSSATASELNAVQLMTIHKAKGLEAKIVLYALPSKRTPNGRIWVEVEDRKSLELPVALVGMQKKPTLFTALFDNEEKMMEMDRINVLYVAMTRPEHKLFVFCEDKQPSDNQERGNVVDNITMLRDFVEGGGNSVSCVIVQPNPSVPLFTVGEDLTKELTTPESKRANSGKKKKATSISVDVPAIVFPDWQGRVEIACQNVASLSPLDADSRRYGILIHDLLSHIIVAEDVDAVVDGYCKENNLSSQVQNDVKNRITAMIEKEEYRKFFDGSCKVKCEVSMAIAGETRRPDRIVFGTDETWVVDFKTGARDENSHKKYTKQVSEYAAALTAMGYPRVQPVIVYL